MLEDRLLSFLKNEDGYLITYPMNVTVITSGFLMLTYRLFMEMKVPEKWSLFLSFAAAGCLLFLFILWGIRDYYGAESTLMVVGGILSIGALAEIGVYRLAEYIWKVPKSGIVLAWITAICIIVPCLRWVTSDAYEGVIITISFDPDGGISIQKTVLPKVPEEENKNAVTDP